VLNVSAFSPSPPAAVSVLRVTESLIQRRAEGKDTWHQRNLRVLTSAMSLCTFARMPVIHVGKIFGDLYDISGAFYIFYKTIYFIQMSIRLAFCRRHASCLLCSEGPG